MRNLLSPHAVLEVGLSVSTCSLMMHITARGALPDWRGGGICYRRTRCCGERYPIAGNAESAIVACEVGNRFVSQHMLAQAVLALFVNLICQRANALSFPAHYANRLSPQSHPKNK